ncbi:MAG: hypothetical protein ABFD49_02620 [Armatimonadota bacterium]|nr:hypothetical protein [bacterium]
MRLIRTIVVTAVLACIVCGSAPATLSWSKIFCKFYKIKSGSKLKEAKCAVCHTKSIGTSDLNSYGKQLEKLKVDGDSLKTIEGKDADKDGATNIEEIKSDTLPGDPKSKPKQK